MTPFRGRFSAAAALLLLLALLSPATGFAHQTGRATFVVHIKPETQQVDTLLSCPMPDVAHAAKVEHPQALWNSLGSYLDRHIAVRNDGKPCAPIEYKLSPVMDPDTFWFLKAFKCAAPLGKVEVLNDAMTETDGGYSHLGRIQLGEDVHTTVFTANTPSFGIQVGPAGVAPEVDHSMGRFVVEGITHILGGLDHVLFVLALILLSRRLRELLIVVTAFTIAHSITLGLAALDVVSVPASVIEPIIALSIIWVAAETFIASEKQHRAYVATFLLGLVHGFGFAYVLRDDVGLPTDALVPALLSFNVGVELGQLAIVLVLYPLRRLMRDRPWERKVVIGLAAAIAGVAAWWFVERVFGL